MRLIAVLSLILIVSVHGQAYIEVYGYGVEARVDTSIGFFGVGTYPAGVDLTWDFFSIATGAGNSNFILRVDDDTYGLAFPGNEAAFTPPLDYTMGNFHNDAFPRLISPANVIHNKWIIDLIPDSTEDISVDQFLKPVLEGDSLGLVQVRYRISNDASDSHTVALEHKWDIMVNGVDDAPVACPASPYSTSNITFNLTTMPTYILIPDDPLSPSITGVMVLDTFDTACPDFFAYGREEDLIYSNFSIDATFATGTYSLSAALLRWREITLAPGEDVELITYYGIGIDYDAIPETPLQPKDINISAHPNPFNSAVTISVDYGSESRSVEQVGYGPAAAEIEIYDVNGRMVQPLTEPVEVRGGAHDNPPSTQTGCKQGSGGVIVWRPDPSVTSGVYLVRIAIGKETVKKRIVYLK